MDEPQTASTRETPDGFESESPPPAPRPRPRQGDIEVMLGRFLIFLAFPLVALAGALRLFDVDLGVFPPRLVSSNPPEASAEPAPVPEKPELTAPDDAGADSDHAARR